MQKYLHRSLDSLLAQDIPKNEYEIIIVNDESKDDSLKIAQEYAAIHDNIIICDKKNGGTGAARNSGLKLATGQYIHFVDPDDYVAENSYKTLLECADKNQLDILTFGVTEILGDQLFKSKPISKAIDHNQVEVVDGMTYVGKTNYNNACWWYLINRDFLNSTGLSFIEGRWMEDSIITPKLLLKARRVADSTIDMYRYMIVPNSARTSKDPSHYHKFIYDIENAVYVFDDILKDIPNERNISELAINRIKTRQQSFVFFLMFRWMKSNLPIAKLHEILEGFKTVNAYPMDRFIGSDFNSFPHKILTLVYNREKLLTPFMHLFRFFYVPIKKMIAK